MATAVNALNLQNELCCQASSSWEFCKRNDWSKLDFVSSSCPRAARCSLHGSMARATPGEFSFYDKARSTWRCHVSMQLPSLQAHLQWTVE